MTTRLHLAARVAIAAVIFTACDGDPADITAAAYDAGPGEPGERDGAPRADAGTWEHDGGDGAPNGALAYRPGCFFASTLDEPMSEAIFVGAAGSEYPELVIDVDIELGPWREDVFDRGILSHNLIHLFRADPKQYRRYLLGVGAQINAAAASLQPRAVFFGRVDLEPRPPGQGYTSYTAFRNAYPWQPSASYHLRIELDGLAGIQRLTLTNPTGQDHVIEGAIDYYEPALTTSGLSVYVGSDETDHRDIAPYDAVFCDLIVREPLDPS